MEKIMLLFDKDFDTVTTIKTLLEKNNYSVVIAKNTEDCLKKLETDKPDLLLMGGFVPRTGILGSMKLKGVKVAYLIFDDTYLGNETELYNNIIGFINEPMDINKFLAKIKEFLHSKNKA